MQGKPGVVSTVQHNGNNPTKKSASRNNTNNKNNKMSNQNQNPNWNPNHHVPGYKPSGSGNGNSGDLDMYDPGVPQQPSMVAQPPPQPKAPSSYGNPNEGGVRKFSRTNRFVSTSVDQSIQPFQKPAPPSHVQKMRSNGGRGSGNVTKSLEMPQRESSTKVHRGSSNSKKQHRPPQQLQRDFTSVGIVDNSTNSRNNGYEQQHSSDNKKLGGVAQLMKWMGGTNQN